MGVPTSVVDYTSAMSRRENHEVRKGHVGALDKKNNLGKMQQFFLHLTIGISNVFINVHSGITPSLL